MLLAKFEFDTWFHFFLKTRKYQKIGLPLKPDDVIECHQMCMNGKVNQGPLFDATDH